MPVIEVNGAQLNYFDSGSPANGVPGALVLVHGFSGSSYDWMDHTAWLAEQRRVVTYDQRGHGDSGHPGDYSLRQLSADLETLLDSLDVQDVVLVGHSMGGVVVQDFALRRTESVRGLILMDTWAGGRIGLADDVRMLYEASAHIAREQGMQVVHELREQVAANLPENEAGKRLVAERPEIAELNDRCFLGMDPEAYAALILEGLTGAVPDMLAEIAGLDVPRLVIVGEADAPFVPAGRRYEAALGAGHVEWIPDAGHSPQFEAPKAWRAAVEGFLGSLG